MTEQEKLHFIHVFLNDLCYIDCLKHQIKIHRLFYQTLDILIVEEQAKEIFRLLKQDFQLNESDLYKTHISV